MTAAHAPQWLRDAVATIGAQWLRKEVSASEADDLAADAIQERHDTGDPYGRSLWLAEARKQRIAWWKRAKDREEEKEAARLLDGFIEEPLFDLPFPLLGGEVSVGFGRMVRQLDMDYDTAMAARRVRANQQATTNAGHDAWLAEIDALLKVLDQDHDKTLSDFLDEPGAEEGTG